MSIRDALLEEFDRGDLDLKSVYLFTKSLYNNDVIDYLDYLEILTAIKYVDEEMVEETIQW